MLGLFFDSGQAISTGMGLVPISWVEMDAWIRVNSLELTLWEIETIKKMSEAYCRENALAVDPQRPAPYKVVTEDLSEDEQYQRAIANAIRMRDALRRGGKKR